MKLRTRCATTEDFFPKEENGDDQSLNGAPATMAAMLDFAARHKIAPQVEHFPMSRVNDALEHLAAAKARYRVVLDPDFV
jgi:D-arabinose 1-dehydrogenase-like Zn-dependent alcohol dehydrogenase